MAERHAQRFAHHLRGRRRAEKLAAAAGRRAGAAAEIGGVLRGDLAVGEARRRWIESGRHLRPFRQQRDAARHQHAGQIVHQASAIIMAGRPLSHVATPRTPRRVGSERIRRRKMVAASLR